MVSYQDPLQTQRPMYFGMAYRLLGSVSDAEDVLQEAYLRWSHTDQSQVLQPRRYLSRIVTHLSIDRLRHRANHETYIGSWLPEPLATDVTTDPAATAEKLDSLSIATLHLLETLDPVERAVFVLRHAFELPYNEIAETVERTPEHCRQIFKRASQRLPGRHKRFSPSQAEHGILLRRFLAAAHEGDIEQLRNVLHSGVVLWTDGGGKVKAALNPVYGPDRVGRFAVGIYGGADIEFSMQELNGLPSAVIRFHSATYLVSISVDNGVIDRLFIMGNPDKISAFIG